MHITVTWFNDAFNVELASQEGREPFLAIKGCRIKDGSKGEFVSWPAQPPKQQGGKWWQHVYASEAFGQAVLEKAKESQPRRDTRTQGQRHSEPPPF